MLASLIFIVLLQTSVLDDNTGIGTDQTINANPDLVVQIEEIPNIIVRFQRARFNHSVNASMGSLSTKDLETEARHIPTRYLTVSRVPGSPPGQVRNILVPSGHRF
jgi:hypothetical protein